MNTKDLPINYLVTLNNNHKEGFDNCIYELLNVTTEYQPNSVALIHYTGNNEIIPKQFYPVANKKNITSVNDLVDSSNIGASKIKLITNTSKDEYLKRVNKLKQHIQVGDIYEINFCVEFEASDVELNAMAVFKKLNSLAEAPYAAIAKLGDEYIISASPELFLRKTNNTLFTKPIKGTAKRSDVIEDDENYKNKLHLSLKERTENVMIVDVARNDFSIIGERASVTVPKLYNIESFKTVHQMVSTVKCHLKPNLNFDTIIKATFPMPSMTGAPKIRAMELINETEQFRREQYSGALGVINENGDFKLSVLIRTIVYNQKSKKLSFGVGSAITHLCNPEEEYNECLLKANALVKALNATIQ